MRKFSWILALLTALAMVFIACPSEGGGGVDWDLDEVTWKYIQVEGRGSDWHSLDIRVDNTLDKWTSGKDHTITVWGAAPGGGSAICFAEAESAQKQFTDVLAVADGKNNGRFRLERKFTWDEINSIGTTPAKAIRINKIAVGPIAAFYEVWIFDSEGKQIYKLSEDTQIQNASHGSVFLVEGDMSKQWFKGAFGGNPTADPTAVIIDPNNAGGYIAASGISGVDRTGKVGEVITLSTTVVPSMATNKAVVWSVEDVGVTATIGGEEVEATATATLGTGADANKLTLAEAGIVIVKATVANGKTETTDAIFYFDIDVTESAELGGTKLIVKAGTVSIDTEVLAVGTGASIDYFSDNTGYQLNYTSGGDNYQRVRAEFGVTFPATKTITDYLSITFDIEGISGDSGYKNVQLLGAEDLGDKFSDGTDTTHLLATYVISKADVQYKGPGKETITLEIDPSKIGTLVGKSALEFSLHVNTRNDASSSDNTPTRFQFSNIVFDEGSLPPCPVCGRLPCECLECGCGCADCIDGTGCDSGNACGDDCECSCHADWTLFNAATGMTVAELAWESNWGPSVTFNAEGNYISVNDSASALFSIIPASLGSLAADDVVVIKYIAVVESGEAKLILKKDGGGTDLMPNESAGLTQSIYPTLVKEKTSFLALDLSAAPAIPTKFSFQDNNKAGVFHIKIISVTKEKKAFDLTLEVDDIAVSTGSFANGKAAASMDGDNLKFAFNQTSGNSQIGIIALTPAQDALVNAAYAAGGSVTVNITGTSSGAANFRAGIGNPTVNASWNGTGLIGGDTLFSAISDEVKALTWANMGVIDGTNADRDNPGSRATHFIIQQRNTTDSDVSIESITITIVPKPAE